MVIKQLFLFLLAYHAVGIYRLIERSARIAASEATADGLNWAFSPMVDIARDPRWGRVAEGSGEDTYLGSQISKAMVKGYQGTDLAAKNKSRKCGRLVWCNRGG